MRYTSKDWSLHKIIYAYYAFTVHENHIYLQNPVIFSSVACACFLECPGTAATCAWWAEGANDLCIWRLFPPDVIAKSTNTPQGC